MSRITLPPISYLLPPTALVVLFYIALTLVLAWPLSVNPAGSVLWTGPDTELFMWTLAWDVHAFTAQPLSIFDANIFHPLRHTLAYSENLIGSALVAAPVLWLTGNPVLAMNVVALLSVVLCGAGTYVLARRVGIGTAGALLAGLIFAFSPPRFFRLGQLHLTAVQWMPFGLAFLHGYLDGGRSRDLRLAAACFSLQALSSGHGAVFLTLAMCGLVAWRVALGAHRLDGGDPCTPPGSSLAGPRRPAPHIALDGGDPCTPPGSSLAGPRRPAPLLALLRRVRDLGITGALLLLPALLVIVPYRIVQEEMGLKRSLVDWATSPASFLASPARLPSFVLSVVDGARINETADAFLFPGYLPLLLAALVCFRFARRIPGTPARRASAVWARIAVVLELAIVVTFAVAIYVTMVGRVRLRIGDVLLFSARDAWRPWFFCAAAAVLRVIIARRAPFGFRERVARWRGAFSAWRASQRGSATGFYVLLTTVGVLISVGPPLGLWPLLYWLPGFNFIRVPSRFTILALLGLAVLAGTGFDWLRTRLSPTGGRVLAVAVAAALAAEFAAVPLTTVPYRLDIPAVDRWLAHQPGPFAVAEMPAPGLRGALPEPRLQTLYMLHSTAHWQKTVHGHSGIEPPLHAELYSRLVTFPDEPSLRALSRFGVRYVVVHEDMYPADQWPAVDADIRAVPDWLRLEHRIGAGRVYSLHFAE